jgi:acyl-CoA thioesterase
MPTTTGHDRADQYEELDPETKARWMGYGRQHAAEQDLFASILGLQVEDVRQDYCRLRMALRPALMQAGGVMHGGAIASLLDSVLVPAIGALLPAGSRFATVDLHVQYMEAVVDSDVVAEGWVVRRGRRVVFGQAEARAASTGRVAATAVLTYNVSPPPAA